MPSSQNSLKASLKASRSTNDVKDRARKKESNRKRHRTTSGNRALNNHSHTLGEFIDEAEQIRSPSRERAEIKPLGRNKKAPKCLFGSECQNKHKCGYYHPADLCKYASSLPAVLTSRYYPNCTYGADCLFIHPKPGSSTSSTPISPKDQLDK